MKTASRKRTRKPRVVSVGDTSQALGIFGFIERVTSTRARLKPEFALAFYSLAQYLAREHDDAKNTVLSKMKPGSPVGLSAFEYHRHAAAALRILAERLLKTFSDVSLLAFERDIRKEFDAAIERLKANVGNHKRQPDDSPVEPEEY